MKKILPIILFSSNIAVAANLKPEVFVGGYFNFSTSLVGQDTDYTENNLPHGTSNENRLKEENYFTQDAYIDILAIGKTDRAALYGGKATIELNSQRVNLSEYSANGNETVMDDSNPIIARRAYMFIEKKTMGRLEFGDVE